MAILEGPLFGTEARGKIRTTVTFFPRKANKEATDEAILEWYHLSAITYRKEHDTPARLIQKNKFKEAIAAWRLLNPQQKEIYAAIATGLQTAYNAFVKEYLIYGEEGPPGLPVIVNRGATLYNLEGIPNTPLNIIVWRAPYAATVYKVRAYRVGGTGATINARRNAADEHLVDDLSLEDADEWVNEGAVQNTAYAIGDKLEIMIITTAGVVTQIAIQIDLIPT